MDSNSIISKLPYASPFLFVDELLSFSEEGIEGVYRFKKEEFFYQGHFKNHPITPGVILTECMAQIGLVCLGIVLVGDGKELSKKGVTVGLTETHIEFLIPVYPEETVRVISEKEYFRFGKLKCKVKMLNEKGEVVCKGSISGMIVNPSYEK